MTTEEKPEGEGYQPTNGTAPKCDALPEADEPPTHTKPEICKSKCTCPGTPPATETCFDNLIKDQAIELAKAEHTKTFKAELEDVLKKANAAKLAYSPGKYEEFKERWLKADAEIIGAIDVVVCNVKCWWCLIECEICSLLYAIKGLDTEINGNGKLIGEVHSLLDLQYWHQRNRDLKTVQFERFKAVLAAWNNPADTIDKALIANDKIVKAIRQMDPVDGLMQMFLKVVPLHLAIGPRDETGKIDAEYTSKIDPKYINLCDCDEGKPDVCCGPDAGVLSVRLQQLVGPQAYIVNPDKYFDILCCLVTKRYLPAKDQLAKAASDLAAVTDEIARKKADLERRKKSIIEDALRSIVKPVDCSKYKSKDGGADCGCGPKTISPPEQTEPSVDQNPPSSTMS